MNQLPAPHGGGDSPDRLALFEERLAALELGAKSGPGSDSKTATGSGSGWSLADRALRFIPLMAISNLMVGVPALAISIGLAYSSFMQAEATDKMQVASVWPRVGYESSNQDPDGTDRISLSLTNKGVGPAQIHGFEVRGPDGRKYTTLDELLLDCCTRDPASLFVGMGTVHGEILRPGEVMMFAQMRRNVPPEVYRRFDQARLTLKVRTCYCSVFEDCWIGDSGYFAAQAVQSCPEDWTEYYGFQQGEAHVK